MRYLGIDYGEKRIGLSYADELGIATPLPAAVQAKKKERLAHIGHYISQKRIEVIVLGYPLNMDGTHGFKAKEVDVFFETLLKQFKLPIHKFDERLSSHQAEAYLSIGKNKKNKNLRNLRQSGEIDSRAATIILQDFLDAKEVENMRISSETVDHDHDHTL